MKPLEGKVAVITGASRGIGRAIAERLARDGASTIVNYSTNAKSAAEVVRAIEERGGRGHAVQGDMGKLADIQRLFDEAKARFGRVDIVIANAATSMFKPHLEVTEDEYDRVFGLNARGTFFVLQEAARRIETSGRIVVVSSGGTSSRGAMPGLGLYVASKAAAEFLVPALAHELGNRDVTVNAVLPGLTDTDGMILPPPAVDQIVQRTPLGRLGKPADIADAVSLLVGPDGHWINGQSIGVSGGL